MIYKTIFLSILLMPLTVMSSASDTQELEEKILQKELEISNLGALIAEKGKFFSSLELEVPNLFIELLNKRIKQLEKNNNLLSQEQKEILTKELQHSVIEFVNTFCADYENLKDIKGMLVKGLIQESSDGDTVEFASIKFILIRTVTERLILKHLISKYESFLQELRELMLLLQDNTKSLIH